ncbi:Leucyl/phenylalanyl-tRNA--protein transferase [Serinicoccus hydrothermalis]|uniref:Leucyl/phenylalanyl-tRNA--protein transferase n=1 Tax=Serinicoccus hydrothermalis TaxID=1758689 RepID=A0A1B1N9Z2_9MICO|nr:leucyl/phenylalanyl-tRNA--protein transferase [Serinicoccus hydrothermalis]ANS78228.1 Leucyl/phenylalanyl-tRNA--protein transferase [Serinicoccus hydrothermalis]
MEPPPSVWDLTTAGAAPGEDLVGIGADLEPGTILAAYRAGLFPMGLGEGGADPLGWWSPDPRGVLLPGDLHLSRSAQRSRRSWTTTVDRAFDDVIEGCADPTRDGGWITAQIAQAYCRLHDLGWAHSVEVWDGDDLVGGVYGLALGRVFAGESMFHRAPDASKAALAGLVDVLSEDGAPWVLDTQWQTPHLRSLGVRTLDRPGYLRMVREHSVRELPRRWRGIPPCAEADGSA